MNTLASEADRADLVRRLRQVRPGSIARWGTMSAPQMVCHLADAYRMATGDKHVGAASSRLPRPVIKWVALYAPMPWPRGILTMPEIDQAVDGTCPGDFTADVAEVERFVERLAAVDRDASWPRHPIFGRMAARDWLRWGYLHMDHHLRQFGV